MKTTVSPFSRFTRIETTGGIIVLVCAICALIIANTSFSSSFNQLLTLNISLKIGEFRISETLSDWIFNGLMALFFFVAGLEIKREVMLGELSSFKKASMPLFAAVGGIVFPAVIYILFNNETAAAHGWAVAAMTDISICFLLINILGNRIPVSLKIFVFAYAIAGNLLTTSIAIIINPSVIDLKFLLIGIGLYLYLIIFNILKIRIIQIYMIIGLVIWYMIYKSGIHPAIAGIFVAFTIPKERKIRTSVFRKRLEANLQEFASDERKSKVELTDKQLTAIDNIVAETGKVKSPLQSLEHKLHRFVSYQVLPLFVLANAGLLISGLKISELHHSVAYVVTLSIVIGKISGIFIISWLAVKLKLSAMPADIKWIHILGAAMLGGIGFSMSLFINELIGLPQELTDQMKTGIYAGTLIAGISGFLLLRFSFKNKTN